MTITILGVLGNVHPTATMLDTIGKQFRDQARVLIYAFVRNSAAIPAVLTKQDAVAYCNATLAQEAEITKQTRPWIQTAGRFRCNVHHDASSTSPTYAER